MFRLNAPVVIRVKVTTGGFSQNIAMLFFELKLVTDSYRGNLSLYLCSSQLRSH